MSSALSLINARAKKLKIANKRMTHAQAIKKASADYRAGKLGKAYKQHGKSNTKRDKQRKAKPPGVRKSKRTGKKYTETRKNRSDKRGAMTGAGVPSQIAHEMKQVQRSEYNIIWARAQMKGATPELKRRLKAAIKYDMKAKQVHRKNITNLKRLI